jgi:hypothetical protein
MFIGKSIRARVAVIVGARLWISEAQGEYARIAFPLSGYRGFCRERRSRIDKDDE